MQIAVMDSDTASDDSMGERDIDLRKQYFWPTADSGQPTAVELYKNGKISGTVYLSFAKSPKKPGQARRPAPNMSSKWVPSQNKTVAAAPVQVQYRKKEPCEEFPCCAVLCGCCLPTPVTRAAVPVGSVGDNGVYPKNFKEVGYRVDLDGKWDRRSLAGEEMHHLDIKPGDDSLAVGAHVEVPVQYHVNMPVPVVHTDVYVEREVETTVMAPHTVNRTAVRTSPVPVRASPVPMSYAQYASPQQYGAAALPQMLASPIVQNSMGGQGGWAPSPSIGYPAGSTGGNTFTPKLKYGI
jgi:hypothetical protein